ncbi:MAG TPA: hypothetical protein VKB27_00640 [Gammaproteobacteria bacterium]|nr:hypothetical protein [Gammaproteobacteria bacterium]
MTGDTRRLFLLAVSCALILAHFPRLHAQAEVADYLCTKDGVTRQIAVVRESGYACRVKYTRPSGTTYPWNARNETDYCRPKASGLAEKLGSFGWTCDAADDVQSILLAQLERYGRYLETLNNAGKTCYFYPGEARYGNLCGDAHAEAAVVYTCDGAEGSWEQHLAVFIDVEDDPLTREVGGSGSRQVAGYYIDDNRLTIESEEIEADSDGASPRVSTATTTLRCRYDAANRWELFEQQ